MTAKNIGFEMSRADILEMTLLMRVGDECPYCGEPMTRKDLDTAITSDVEARPSHATCWERHVAKS